MYDSICKLEYIGTGAKILTRSIFETLLNFMYMVKDKNQIEQRALSHAYGAMIEQKKLLTAFLNNDIAIKILSSEEYSKYKEEV